MLTTVILFAFEHKKTAKYFSLRLNLCNIWPDCMWLRFAIRVHTNSSQNSWFKITDSCFQTLYQLPTSQYNPRFTLHESFHSLPAAACWAIPALPSFPWQIRVKKVQTGICTSCRYIKWDKQTDTQRNETGWSSSSVGLLLNTIMKATYTAFQWKH